MLKTSNTESADLKKSRAVVGNDNRARRNRNEIDRSRMDNIEVDSGKVRDDKVGKKGRKIFKSKNLSKSKKTVRSAFFTPGARLTFTKLRQAFFKAPILHYLDPECHIWIETDVSGYAISGVFSQLTSNDLDQ